MPQFETSDRNEVARYKRSQFSVRVINFPMAGVTGLVNSIVAIPDCFPLTWVVTFTPKSLPTDIPTKKLIASR